MCSGSAAEKGPFSLEDVKARVTELRRNFDYLLFGTGSVETDPQALLLAQLSDAVVLVLEANATRRDRVEKMKRTLSAAGRPFVGGGAE